MPDVDVAQMREDIKRLSLGRNDVTVSYPYLFTEDHLWLRPKGDGTFFCGVTPFWYTFRGSGFQLFDAMQVPHWIVNYPVGETLMDERDYSIYVSKLVECREEWYKTPFEIIKDMHNRKRITYSI